MYKKKLMDFGDKNHDLEVHNEELRQWIDHEIYGGGDHSTHSIRGKGLLKNRGDNLKILTSEEVVEKLAGLIIHNLFTKQYDIIGGYTKSQAVEAMKKVSDLIR